MPGTQDDGQALIADDAEFSELGDGDGDGDGSSDNSRPSMDNLVCPESVSKAFGHDDECFTASGGAVASKQRDPMTAKLAWAAVFAALGGILFGYDLGIVSGALLQLEDEEGKLEDTFHLTTLQQELVVSLFLVGAIAASLTAGYIVDYFGQCPCAPVPYHRRVQMSTCLCPHESVYGARLPFVGERNRFLAVFTHNEM